MPGLNVALHTGKTSLLTNHQSIATVGNNIANADSVGYHRQVLQLGTNPALTTTVPSGQIGTGVHVDKVLRIYDATLERNLRQAVADQGYKDLYASKVSVLEETLAPGGESLLQQSMQDFSNAVQGVSNEPNSQQARSTLIYQGGILADVYNLTRTQVVASRDEIADATGQGALLTKVNSINAIAEEITALNKQISELETNYFQPQNANDLRDQRDVLASELTKMADIEVTEMPDRTYHITMDGQDLVFGDIVTPPATLTVNMTATGPEMRIAGTLVGTLDGGETQALIDSYAYIQATIDEYDQFATTLTTTLNAVHAAGFDAAGAAGGPLFDNADPAELKFLITDPDKIAASAVAGEIGDSGNARAIWTAMNTPLAALNNNSILENADKIVDNIALDSSRAKSLAEGATASVEMYTQALSSLSGVNVDEEMMTMLEVQRAYQASAKFVGVVDEMLEQALNMT